jgi:cell wall assembly regulator SMI1
MVRILSPELLAELERLLAAQPGDLHGRLRPGLEVGEIRRMFRSTGIIPSQEAEVWWSWHNGSEHETDVLPGLGHVGLETALDVHQRQRSLAVELAAQGVPPFDDPDAWWHPGWVSIFGTGGLSKITLDCSGPHSAPSPLRQIDWDCIDGADYGRAFAPSLGDYVARAVAALAAGRYRYDPAEQSWEPPDWALTYVGDRF